MADPRLQPNYKQKHHAERLELLLGAILDELIKANGPVTPIEQPREIRRAKKSD